MMQTRSTDSRPEVHIFTDGACAGNPGPGGWAAILREVRTGKEIELSGATLKTTNNQMEMQAVIEALKRLKKPCRVRLVTDSQYVAKGLSEWLPAWQAKNWKTAGGSPVKNRDLWETLAELKSPHQLECVWVRGHTGHPENERCDELAREAIEAL